MQQHLMQMQPMMAAYYPSNVTTDHIQQYLDENKSLILKIVESQNSGKMSECAENQARLQRNLMYLAAIADSQPQPPTMHSQYTSGGILQPGAHYLQHQQAQQMTSQSLMAARSSMLYGAQPYPSLQQQALHNQLSMSSGGGSSGLMLQGEPHSSGASSGLGGGGFPDFSTRGLGGGSKQDMGNNASGEGRGGSDGGETSLYLKSGEDCN
ncbi:SSXT family protein [Perilla frutescens var. hirtella]|uniref:SSXT family protein n=1 Tax=Perilla frutescens var. hirtella TaxID=608512 RepID=A0AAD4J3H9_PERFH|nr:SSXT family protein [Perilla frutescens var. hirtella]KAH6826505.1 SSXT family protein [Perilla frutescens var. hirtella]